ncbi:MAG: alpha/beta hydrolase [Oscillospiraceae bacterium]|jgi:pimeloyl-ACP methyl ester carboxylesterase|nr:alpha/beta hydrolase [Oscillospiraceae bacterium]
MRIQLEGVDISYEQHGAGKPDVLLLHGWGCSGALMQSVTDALAAHCRVTVIDFPGHGQSGRPPMPWGAEEYARLVAALIQTLHIEGCDIIGHSHGGRVALLLAAEHPELVGKLLVTGAAGLHKPPTKESQRRSKQYKRLRGLLDVAQRLKIFGTLPERLLEKLRQRYGSPDYRALDAQMRKTFVKVVGFDIEPYLPKVKAPTLLVWGDADTETPLWMGQKMESLIPDAGLAILKGGTHFAYLEKAGEFNRIALHFFVGGKA